MTDQRRTGPYRVMFVCLGNICRSPMARVIVQHDMLAAGLADEVRVDSAGLGSWHIGEPMDRRAAVVLRDHGYAVDHAAKQLTAEMLAHSDLVVAMDESNLKAVRRMLPDRTINDVRLLREFDADAESLEVPDPYYGGREGFVEVFDLIRNASTGLIGHVRQLSTV